MARGNGKLILLGEHAVVYGYPALAVALERGVEARAEAAACPELRIEPWGVCVTPDACDAAPKLARAFAALLDAYPSPPAAVVQAQVELPAAAGLGCSAALGVATAGAIDEVSGISRSPEALAQLSMAWERVFHGQPSGIDSAMAVARGAALYRNEPGRQRSSFGPSSSAERLSLRSTLHLVVANSGERSETSVMVAEVARRYDRSKALVQQTFEGIAALVANARSALERGELDRLGQLMDLNQTLLSGLMLSTSRLEELCSTAREAGALGAKLTGAGGGGCMVALADDAYTQAAVLAALKAFDDEAFSVEVTK